MKTLRSFAGLNLILPFFAAAVADVTGSQTVASAYSLAIPRGISSIANHLDHGENTVAELLPNVPEGTLLYKFDSIRQIYTVNQFQFGAWLRPKETLPPGEGALIRNPGDAFSITFAGTKPRNTQFPILNGAVNLISLPVPGETSLPPPKGGDQIVRFDASPQSFKTYTFDDLDNDWIPRLGSLTKVGESFLYRPRNQRVGADVVRGGTIYFGTYLPGAVDARIRRGDGTSVGEGLTAQLYGGPAGTPTDQLVPLTPATTLQLTSAAVMGYVNPVVAIVPGVAPGASATLVMRVFDGAAYDSSIVRGESIRITIALPNPALPPANLAGLEGFSLPATTGGRGQIGVERTANGLRLTYTGTLQSADTVTGPYADVAGATSPASLTFSGTAKFYRLKP